MSAICVFTNNMTKNISGKVDIHRNKKRGLQIKINISGISPGKHGFHIHEYGDLSEGCGSLCSHYNPTHSVHGGRNSEERHLGDLGNVIANEKGVVDMTIYDRDLSITGKYSILGRSVVVHEREDDLGLGGLDKNGNVIDKVMREESLKTGNAGKTYCMWSYRIYKKIIK